jgi:molybdate transport system substrate-binding protein
MAYPSQRAAVKWSEPKLSATMLRGQMKANRHMSVAVLAIVSTQIFQIMSTSATEARAGEITVAAAADLTFVFKEVGARFQKETGNSIKISYGSSGNFFSQIKNGAPYDMFFSADVSFPKKLEAAGLTEPGTLYEYATGKLVVWVPSQSKFDINQGLKVLLDPGISKIAIANPVHAPHGAAAVAAMQHEGIYDQVKGKIIQGDNILQAAQFVQSGNADVGLIALSLALAPPMKSAGRYFEIPSGDYPPIIQAVVILKSAKDKDTAEKFLKFLKEPTTVAIMQQYGFVPPGAAN